jgi:ElaB/YqjD/DUF883 family membrane-anchored ribosome-binding protein
MPAETMPEKTVRPPKGLHGPALQDWFNALPPDDRALFLRQIGSQVSFVPAPPDEPKNRRHVRLRDGTALLGPTTDIPVPKPPRKAAPKPENAPAAQAAPETHMQKILAQADDVLNQGEEAVLRYAEQATAEIRPILEQARQDLRNVAADIRDRARKVGAVPDNVEFLALAVDRLRRQVDNLDTRISCLETIVGEFTRGCLDPEGPER